MVTTSDGVEVRDSDPGQPVREVKAAQAVRVGESAPRRRRFRYTLPGAWVAVAFACLSFTPSLVPRPGAFQGVVCGITAAIGYGVGVLGARIWREFADRPARQSRRRSWRVFLVVGAVMLLAFFLLGQRWQGQIRDLMSAEPEGLGSKMLSPVMAVLVFVGLVAGGAGHSAVLLVGGRAAQPVDGAAGRAGAGVGAGRGAHGGAGQRGGGGRGHRRDQPDLLGARRHDQ